MSRRGALDISQRSSLNLATSCFPPLSHEVAFLSGELERPATRALFRRLRHMTPGAKPRRFRPENAHQPGQHLRKGPDVLRRL